ncbi:flagellar hook-associated protein FlgK [Phenylobacterium montanum]|uniref:Flagellar hook-associated protein 1 n=1 Tax=Phenylobacterium montanum TaxID=2823693 RepID=A0A975IY28_9CAUL|nr:flagellar hook-associated protein FlgK [Caulobacter sp. S6]QUD90031.1 flagellar hook-associated protein FlgK [Caulobacter sp. S6]
MSTLNSITQIATQGLYVAQTGINTVSDNITNVNTPGYVRKVINPEPVSVAGVGDGVNSAGISLATNIYLDNASNRASADLGDASITSTFLSQAQSFLGDPGASTGFFNQLNSVFSAFSAAANTPSTVSSTAAVNQVTSFLNQAQSVASSLNQLSSQADNQIGSDVTQVNQLLGQISQLNNSIVQSTSEGADPTDAQNAQNNLLNQLSSLMDVKIARTSTGGVGLSTSSGQILVSQAGAATLSYTPATSGATQVSITQPGTGVAPVSLQVQSGEIQGLLTLRNSTLPAVQDQVSEFVTQTVNALNAAHNASTSVPAPNTLTGSNVGTDIQTALSGFTGTTNIAVVNSSGVIQTQASIDFTAGTITVGGVATAFTPSNFAAQLNSALGGAATVNVVNNGLTISAASSSNGIAIADDPTTPSNKGGEGFSQYFGLNNLINSSIPTNYNTGLQPADANGFNAGGVITLRLSNGSGGQIMDVPVTIPAGGTIQNVLDTMNQTTGGVGLYGQFSLDANGQLSFTSNTPGAASVSVVSDNTQWGASGSSLSQIFGLGAAQRAQRTASFSVRSDIAANPTNISFAHLNLSAAAGTAALSAGDTSGALALANAGSIQLSFGAAGGMGAATTTVSQYAAQLAGALGNQASAASTAQTNAQAVQTEAQSRQQSIEGVNLDQELVNLTTYQQAYSASARLITATSDMFTALMNIQ